MTTERITEAVVEQHRRAVIAEVTKAMERGYSATHIGIVILADPGFVSKLFGGHNYRAATLIRAHDNMARLDQYVPGKIRRKIKRRSRK